MYLYILYLFVCFLQLTCNLHKKTFIKQISNTEKEKTPGVKNWYTLKSEIGNIDDIFSCQRENIYYDKFISGMYIAVIFLLILSGIVLIVKVDDRGLLFCASLSLVIKVIEYIVEIFRYFSCHSKINKLVAKIEESIDITLIMKLQDTINHRRQLNIVPFSLFHKLFSKLKIKHS